MEFVSLFAAQEKKDREDKILIDAAKEVLQNAQSFLMNINQRS